MNILQSNQFKQAVKRLHRNQKADLDRAIRAIMAEPDVGQSKLGDLSSVRVYKFKMNKQLTLIAYTCSNEAIVLLAVGSHENFYRDLKK